LPVGSINSDGDGSCGKSSFQWTTVSFSNVSEFGDSVSSVLSLACLIFSNIGISRSAWDTLGNDVLEGRVHPSTVATSVTIWGRAINKFLFREGVKTLSGNSISSFSSTNSWESPAWSAWSLVSNGVEDTFSGPINISSKWFTINFRDGNVGSFRDFKTEVGADEFFVGDIHELVEVKGIGLFWSFKEVLDVDVVLVEDGQSVVVLFWGGILSSVLSLPFGIEINNLAINSWDSFRDSGLFLHHVECTSEEGSKTKGQNNFFHFKFF
jgi:hypothetical protein